MAPRGQPDSRQLPQISTASMGRGLHAVGHSGRVLRGATRLCTPWDTYRSSNFSLPFSEHSLCMLRRYTWGSQKKKKKLQHYKRRQPETSVLYQIVYHGHEELQHVWESRFQHEYGYLRDEVTKTFNEYLNCGILAHGAAREARQNLPVARKWRLG